VASFANKNDGAKLPTFGNSDKKCSFRNPEQNMGSSSLQRSKPKKI
jgi:hypothetical protein